jgi:hypothetical protein
MSRHRNTGHRPNVKAANEPFKNVEKFKCLGTVVEKQNLHSRSREWIKFVE